MQLTCHSSTRRNDHGVKKNHCVNEKSGTAQVQT